MKDVRQVWDGRVEEGMIKPYYCKGMVSPVRSHSCKSVVEEGLQT